MKVLKYVLVLVIAFSAASCVEEPIGPLNEEDLPISLPPPPCNGCK